MNPCLLVLGALLCGVGLGGWEPASWTGTNKIQAGFKVIVQDQVHQRTDNLYTYTYAPAFSTTPFTALGVIAFETTDLHAYLLKFMVNIPNYTSSTSLQIRMVYPTDTNWRHFRVSYIAVDSSFSQLRVDYFSRTNPSNVGSGVGKRIHSGTFTLNIAPLDMTHQNAVMPLLVGLTATSINGQHSVDWQISLKNSTTINYQITVDRTTQVTQFVSYILVVDRTSVARYLEAFVDEIYVAGTDNTPSFQQPNYYSITNLHAGLNSFSFELVAFSFDKNSFTLTSEGFYNSINVTVWNFRERHCSIAYPFYELASDLCYDSCPPGFVNENGSTKKYCAGCDVYISYCQICSTDGSLCSQCWGNFELNPETLSCFCPEGFYISTLYYDSVDICRPCHAFCETCSGPNSDNCLSCGRFRTINGTVCTCDYGAKANGQCYGPCNDQGCEVCDASPAICQQCAISFILSGSRCVCGERRYYNLDLGLCEDCHYSCLYCSGPGSDQCDTCDRAIDLRYFDPTLTSCLCINNYEEVNSTCEPAIQIVCTEEGYVLDPAVSQCKEICGDGLLIELQCDDGNRRQGDGCSPSCKIERGFMCADNSLAPSRRSYCSFIGEIKFTLTRAIKDIYSNHLNLTYKMEPTLHHVLAVYPELSANIQFEPSSLKVRTLAAQYLTSERILEVEIEYEEDLQSKDLTIVFYTPQTAETFAVAVSRSTHSIQPQNNLAALAYSSQDYRRIRVSGGIGKATYIGGLLAAGMLFFFRKMIGLEYICMLQLVYFSSLITDYSHPMLGPLQEWDYANGYNALKVHIEGLALVTTEWRVLGYHNFFFANFNVMLFGVMGIYFVALLLLVLSAIADRTAERKLKDASKFFALEIGFAFIIFSLNNILVSVVMEYQSDVIFSFNDPINKLILLLAIGLVVVHIALFATRAHENSDSMTFYHRHKPHTHFFPLALILRNLALMIVVLLEQLLGEISTHFCLGIQAVYLVAVITARPYRKVLDYVRFGVVEATLSLSIICRFIQANFVSSPYATRLSLLIDLLVYLILGGFLLSLLMTLASFFYHFWKGRTKEVQIVPEGEYEPPVIVSPKKEKHKSLEYNELNESGSLGLKEPEKSKQLMIFDLEEDQLEENTGGTEGAVNSNYFEQHSKRRLKPKKSSHYR